MRQRPALTPLVAVLCCVTAAPAHARDAGAPPARTDAVADVYHGRSVPDPYRWLEEGDSTPTRDWVAVQNARTRGYLDALPSRPALRRRVEQFITQSSPRHYGLTGVGSTLFAIYFDPARQQPMLQVMGADVDPAGARTILDPNVLDPSGGTAIDWYVPSPDGRLVAVSLSRGGSEVGALHLYDVGTGRVVGESIPRVQRPTAGGDVAWLPDSSGFWYTRYPGEERPEEDRAFYQQVYLHRIGRDPAKDERVFGDGLPRIAEIQLDYSPAAHLLVISVQKGDGGEFAHYVGGSDGKFTQVTRFDDGVEYAAFGPDRALYLVSEDGAPRRRVLKLAPGVLDLTRAQTIVDQREDVIVSEFFGENPLHFAGQQMYVRYIAGGPSRVRVFDLLGRPRGELDLPEVCAVDEIEALSEDLLYSVETYLAPREFRRRSGDRSTPTALRITSPVRFDDMEIVRVFATSRDGTRVPVNIVRRRGAPLNGTMPTLLYGYGGYGSSQTPFFLGGSRRIWFDAGGVFAIANIRGGGEYGEEWHQQGALARKQNVFDDFIAAAELLIREGYTSTSRLALRGGSNGGLLMGAVMTQRPDLARAIVAEVGFFDSLRFELEPNGAFNVTEFGTVQDPDQFRALYAYSPYHNVRDGISYPAVLLTTAENDGRVAPWHSRKMAARLQAATASDRPVYLLQHSESGHGIGSPLTAVIDRTADYLAFLFDQLGMQAPTN
jgi:prolyl oligopeptidase